VRTYLDCYPCFLRQALDAARLAGADEGQQRAILDRTLELLGQIQPTCTPPEIGDQVHRLVRHTCGHADPYQAAKEASTAQALALYPRLRARIQSADDPLDIAVRLGIAGNIIDFGPDQTYDLWQVVERVLAQPFAIDDRPALYAALAKADRLLYLADNAGETVFDRLLIEALPLPVTYAVKSGAVLNDATQADARAAGVDRVAVVIETGSDAPGTLLHRCSAAFQERFARSAVIVAKGQANYETLSAAGPRLFFLLQVKCPIIARDVGVPQGSIVVKRGDPI
jgi:hypothetical protein